MKKKLIIVSFLVMCLVFGTVPVFAADITISDIEYDAEEHVLKCGSNEFALDGNTLSRINNGYRYSIFIGDRTALGYDYYEIFIVTYSSDFVLATGYPSSYGNPIVWVFSSSYELITSSDPIDVYTYKITCDLSSGSFTSDSYAMFKYNTSKSCYRDIFGSGPDNSCCKILFSSHDIYKSTYSSTSGNHECDGTLFFQKTSLLTLPPVAEKMDLSLTMAELIGVLPLVIGLVVCCLGLRKGWNLLAAALHKA